MAANRRREGLPASIFSEYSMGTRYQHFWARARIFAQLVSCVESSLGTLTAGCQKGRYVQYFDNGMRISGSVKFLLSNKNPAIIKQTNLMLQGSCCPGVGEKWQGDSHDERPPKGQFQIVLEEELRMLSSVTLNCQVQVRSGPWLDRSWRKKKLLSHQNSFLQHNAPMLAGMWGAKMSGGHPGNFQDHAWSIIQPHLSKQEKFAGRRKKWHSTWQAILRSSEAWSPRNRFQNIIWN